MNYNVWQSFLFLFERYKKIHDSWWYVYVKVKSVIFNCLGTFWERTVEKLRNKCYLLFTYPLPNHSSLTQHGTATLAFCYAIIPIRVFTEKIDTTIQWITDSSPRLNQHILQCAISKMYQENTHVTWNTHTHSMKMWLAKTKLRKTKRVGRSHCQHVWMNTKVIEPQFLQMQVCQKQRQLIKMDRVEQLAQGKYHR